MTDRSPKAATRSRIKAQQLCTFLGTVASMAMSLAAPAFAQTDALSFVDVCLTPSSNIEDTVSDLHAVGWTTPETLPDSVTTHLAWIGATAYFTGDSGGESLETVLALKTKSAQGLLRKRDIPQSKGRFLVRQTHEIAETLHVMWRLPVPKLTEIECRAALSPDTMRDMRNALGDTANLPAFAALPQEKRAVGHMQITLLNAQKLASHSPPDAILQTYLTTKSQ